MSCLTTSATRRSRSVPAAVLIASAAASSHEVLLVPMISVTLYTLMTLSSYHRRPAPAAVQLVTQSPGRVMDGGRYSPARGLAAAVPRPADLTDLVRAYRKDDANLIAAAVPRVGSPQVALGEGLDVFRAALGGDADDPPADRVIARRTGRVAHVHRHPRLTLDIPDLLVALDRVDDDMLAVGG